MSTADSTPEDSSHWDYDSALEVRKAAARVAVAASKKTGRPVPSRVKELAESPSPFYFPRPPERGWRRWISALRRRNR